MHTVRVYLNDQEGTRWWAEDDLGFTGGADRLSELVDKIHEWAECEGVLDVLSVQLIDSTAKGLSTDNWSQSVKVTGLYHPASAGTRGVVCVGPVMVTA